LIKLFKVHNNGLIALKRIENGTVTRHKGGENDSKDDSDEKSVAEVEISELRVFIMNNPYLLWQLIRKYTFTSRLARNLFKTLHFNNIDNKLPGMMLYNMQY